MTEKPILQISPTLDRASLAQKFAAESRVQVRNVLTPEAAATIHDILARHTPWGLAWSTGDTPSALRADEMSGLPVARRQEIAQSIASAARAKRFTFAYHRFWMVEAALRKWNPGGPHDQLLDHVNAAPMLDLVRQITGISELIRADAQATLYSPNQFLGVHEDVFDSDGWRVAYVLNLTHDWHENWGGYLLFYDEEGDVVGGFKPRFNSLNLFAVPQRHSVTYVPPFAPVGRFAITGWFRDR